MIKNYEAELDDLRTDLIGDIYAMLGQSITIPEEIFGEVVSINFIDGDYIVASKDSKNLGSMKNFEISFLLDLYKGIALAQGEEIEPACEVV